MDPAVMKLPVAPSLDDDDEDNEYEKSPASPKEPKDEDGEAAATVEAAISNDQVVEEESGAFDLPDFDSPKGTFDTEDSDFEILPDDEEDQQRADAAEKSLQIPDGSDEGSGDDYKKSTSLLQPVLDDPEDVGLSPRASPPASPPTSPKGSPPEATLSPKSRQRRFMDRFSQLSMSPKRTSEKHLKVQQQEDAKEEKKKAKNTASDLKSPMPRLKAMKAKVLASMEQLPDVTTAIVGEADEFSSDDEYSDDDILSIGDDDILFEDDVDQVIDFSTLTHLPTSFLGVAPDTHDYLDSDVVKNVGSQDISVFAWEHHLLVKGLLQLLAERDHIGVEDDVHETSNILKMGILKKRYAQIWFVKFVEVRKGNLSFYDDNKMNNNNDDESSSGRRTIHLRKRTCTCEAVTNKDGSSGGYVFELKVEGGPKRLWMAKSEEERQGWIRAINQAMIGDNDDSLHVPMDLTPYKSAIDVYESVQTSLKEVTTRQEYMVAVNSLLYRQRSSSALRLPIQWVREHVANEEDAEEEDNNNQKPLAAKRHVRSTISDLWENLCNTSVTINGYLVKANGVYSAERVIGAISRCILEFDKVKYSEEADGTIAKNNKDEERISELEAVSYGRSILRSILRSKSRGDALSAVEELVRNELISCVQVEKSEPIFIDVSFAGDDFSEDDEPSPNDISGWISARTKKSKNWKTRFFVVSEGVLSFFEKAEPRPSGLRGQLVLADAKLKLSDGNIIGLQTKEREIRLKFDNRGEFVKWKLILERATDFQEEAESHPGSADEPRQKKTTSIVGAGKGTLKSAAQARKRAIKAMKGRFKDAKSYMSRGVRGTTNEDGPGTPGRQRPTNDMLMTSTSFLQSDPKSGRRDPSVQVFVEENTVFKVVARSENEDKDALLVVRAKVFQAFLLSGGANGRLARGVELLEMEFMEGDDLEEMEHEFLEPPTVL